MGQCTFTICEILKSLHPEHIYYGVREDGNYYSPDEIIEGTWELFWRQVNPPAMFDEYLCKEFLQRYYTFEIGYTTAAEYFQALHYTLNVECSNAIWMYHNLQDKTVEDLMISYNNESHNASLSNNKATMLGATNSTPQTDLNIIVQDPDSGNRTIPYADGLQESEQHNDQEAQSANHSKGFNGMPLFMFYYQYARMSPYAAIIINTCGKHFLQCF